jgi:hypothetical protein
MSYKVTMQYANSREMPSSDLKTFKNMGEAEAAIKEKLIADAALKVRITYRIYEWDDLIKEFDPSKIDLTAEDTESSQGQGSGATFRPTPFNPAPKPGGIPQNWLKDDDDKKTK